MLIQPHRICSASDEEGKVAMIDQEKCIPISKYEYRLLGYNAVQSGDRLTDTLKKHTDSIFRKEKWTMQETNMK